MSEDTNFEDFLMDDDQWLENSLLPVAAPSFGWYKVRVGWCNPTKKVRSPEEAAEVGKKPYAIAGIRLNVEGRVIFHPDPEKENNALFSEEGFARGSFFADMFWGSEEMENALRAFGRKIESTGITPQGKPARTPEDVYNALMGGEAYVRVYHRELKDKEGNKTGRKEVSVGQWRSVETPPQRTFVPEPLREEFISRYAD